MIFGFSTFEYSLLSFQDQQNSLSGLWIEVHFCKRKQFLKHEAQKVVLVSIILKVTFK